MAETKPTAPDFRAENERLRAENEALRAELAARLAAVARPANPEPRFELSAGEQHDLQVHGVTRSARTGATIVASDFPEQVDLEALSDQARAADARERKARDARPQG